MKTVYAWQTDQQKKAIDISNHKLMRAILCDQRGSDKYLEYVYVHDKLLIRDAASDLHSLGLYYTPY